MPLASDVVHPKPGLSRQISYDVSHPNPWRDGPMTVVRNLAWS